ncbi:MAG: tripartite tricarboxylate transporter substrate binding protein [Burkholderiales bacterium]|nr:tripartite tricarboxylate transporter substrate binding protein [Burkholderiales bacterium]
MIRSSAVVVLAALATGPVSAQDSYPARPINIVVPFTAGAQPDILARAFADGLARLAGQATVVINRDGASGTIAVESVARAAADGYTLGFGPAGQFTLQPHIRRDLGYRFDSFEFLCQTNASGMVIAVGPNSPHTTLAQLIEAARKAPGRLNFGSAGHATVPHLIAESIAVAAGVQFTHVPFKNIGDMYVQAVNGTLDFISSTPTALGSARGMRGLAVTHESRLAGHPDVPTLRELGFAQVSSPGLSALGVYAPRGIPAAAVAFLRGACPKALDTPAARAAAEKTQTPITYQDGPAYAASLARDVGRLGELLATVGLKAP